MLALFRELVLLSLLIFFLSYWFPYETFLAEELTFHAGFLMQLEVDCFLSEAT
jgi:hypothetical protein